MNRREFLVESGLLAYASGAGGLAPATAIPDNAPAPQSTLSLEDNLRLGARHLERLVDEKGRTYFDVFLSNPPEAVTDWPDFVDLPSRYLEGCILTGSVLSSAPESQTRLANWLYSKFEPDGLAYRPDGPISNHIAELFDQSRLFYALNTAAMQNSGDELDRNRLTNLADGLKRLSTRQGDYAYIDKIGFYFGGTLIRPMMQAGIVLNRPDLIELAAAFARGIVDHSDLTGQDGSFTGHVHAALGSTAGIIAAGVKTGDRHLIERGRATFEYAKSISTEFGWVPELSKRDDDVIACETCALMDYLDVALLLARHVDPAYYEVVEKAARNHLWESQIRDASWLRPATGEDEDGVFRTALSDRVRGSSCGWSAPHCSLAYYEFLSNHWARKPAMRSRYMGKIRAQQNCCAGAGIRATYQVWSNVITEEQGQVSVNMSLDRATPRIQVSSFVPFEGRVRISVTQDVALRWKKPSHCKLEDVHVKCTARRPDVRGDGPFLSFGRLPAGAVLDLSFPLPKRRENITIGNKGFQQYQFEVDWRGDTVLAVKPDPSNPTDAFSKLMGKRVTSFYHCQGPGPLYQRHQWAEGLRTKPAICVVSAASIDWYKL